LNPEALSLYFEARCEMHQATSLMLQAERGNLKAGRLIFKRE
jgi:hypothetical protein